MLRLYSEKQGRGKLGITETANPYQIELVRFAACNSNSNKIYERNSEAGNVELI